MELYLPEHKVLGQHQFAIIDKHITGDLSEQYPTLDIVSAHLKPQSHLYPALISLHELSSSDWKSLINEIEQLYLGKSIPRVTLLLESQLSAEAIRNELANALIISDEQQNYVLRYYDPRVLFQLSWMLTPWQLQSLLKTHMIPSWTYMLENQWYTLHFPEYINYQKNDPIDIPLAQIHRIGLINQILDQLPIITSLTERIEISRDIDKLLIQADHCGLIEKRDVAAFVLQGINQQCAFWLNQEVIELLDIAKNNKGHYRRVTLNWNVSHWEKIVANSPKFVLSKGR